MLSDERWAIVLTEKTVAIAVGSSALTVFSGETPVR
ncbi:hypothetical protein OFEAOIEE_LOCUS2518 [Methylorubrum extorquens]